MGLEREAEARSRKAIQVTTGSLNFVPRVIQVNEGQETSSSWLTNVSRAPPQCRPCILKPTLFQVEEKRPRVGMCPSSAGPGSTVVLKKHQVIIADRHRHDSTQETRSRHISRKYDHQPNSGTTSKPSGVGNQMCFQECLNSSAVLNTTVKLYALLFLAIKAR